MTMMITRSSTALANSVAWSPRMPSWMEPTMAIAPMQTVRDAVTKAPMKPPSDSLFVLTLSQAPKRSIRSSRSSSSPRTAPTASERIIIMVPCTVSAPPSARSICESAPETPTNSTLTPMALISVFCSRSGMRRPPSRPASPPTTIAATLTIVPNPCIRASPLLSLVSSQYSTGFRPLQAKKEARSGPFVCYI